MRPLLFEDAGRYLGRVDAGDLCKPGSITVRKNEYIDLWPPS